MVETPFTSKNPFCILQPLHCMLNHLWNAMPSLRGCWGVEGEVEAPSIAGAVFIIAITGANEEAMRYTGERSGIGVRYVSIHLPVVSSWPTSQPFWASCERELIILTFWWFEDLRETMTREPLSQCLTPTVCSVSSWQVGVISHLS